MDVQDDEGDGCKMARVVLLHVTESVLLFYSFGLPCLMPLAM